MWEAVRYVNPSLEHLPCLWRLHWRNQKHWDSPVEGMKALRLLTGFHPAQTVFTDSRESHVDLDLVNTWAVWT